MPASWKAASSFAALALLTGVVTALNHERTRVLDRDGQVTTAVVLDVDRWVRGGPEAELRFTTDDGVEVVTSTQEFSWSPRTRGEVRIEYAARDPYYYVRDPDAAGAELRFYRRVTVVLVLLAVLTPLLRRPVLRLRGRVERSEDLPAPPRRHRLRVQVDADGNARGQRRA